MEASSAQSACVLRFGVFELDVRSGELRKSGVRVPLQEQPLKLLQCLLERPGELVTREELRRRLWLDDTFVDFEQGVNAAVRRLREALADSADTPRFVETLPKRGYRFIAPVLRDDADRVRPVRPGGDSGAATEGNAAAVGGLREAPASRWYRGLMAAGAIAAVIATMVAWLRRPAVVDAALPMELTPLTTLTGSESAPTFSPDGRQVAFVWDGEQQDNSDIYVKLVGSSELRRLTTDQAADFAPQWSPDGKWIAYARTLSSTSHRIRVMSSLGGSDRALGDFPLRPPAAWSPDGRYLVAGKASLTEGDRSIGLYLIPVDVGEPRQLTRAVASETDVWPAFSPDGRRLAYASCREFRLAMRTNCYVQLLDLDSTWAPVGSPRRLTRRPFWTMQGLAWSRDGRSVIFGAQDGGIFHLWRVAADGEHPPARVEVAGIEATYPATAASADRLAFSTSIDDYDVYRVDAGGVPRPIARSSLRESFPAFSPDGQRIVFCSARSGDRFEIWVANSDGSNPEQLTRGPGRWQCSPTWSPDGRRIAFDSQTENGSWHIWTIDLGGGTPQQITKDDGDQMRPTWSSDGQWIYFLWQREDGQEIWRTRGPNQPHERVTFTGAATRAWESADGVGVFYKRRLMESPVEFQPLSRGAPRQVIPCVTASLFATARDGVYYVPCQPQNRFSHDVPVHVLNPVTGEDRRLTALGIPFPATWPRVGTFAVSPDGQTFLYITLASSGADLMLIENFR